MTIAFVFMTVTLSAAKFGIGLVYIIFRCIIRNITLFAVLIYELFGPMFTKMALTAAGDIKEMPEHIKNRRQDKLKEVEQKRKQK